MSILYVFVAIVIIVAVALVVLKSLFEEGVGVKPKYRYSRKQFFLSRAEHECYDALIAAVGNEYYIFAQVHLPTIIDHRIKGEKWYPALAHINRKSVDFVLCDKAYISPKLAIELDDRSHERPDRQERDIEVERILKEAGLPLLRIQNHGTFNPSDLSQKIREAITNR